MAEEHPPEQIEHEEPRGRRERRWEPAGELRDLPVEHGDGAAQPVEERRLDVVGAPVGGGKEPVPVPDHLDIHQDVFILVRRPDVPGTELVEEERVAERQQQEQQPLLVAAIEGVAVAHAKPIGDATLPFRPTRERR
jgi:hypothetical protein